MLVAETRALSSCTSRGVRAVLYAALLLSACARAGFDPRQQGSGADSRIDGAPADGGGVVSADRGAVADRAGSGEPSTDIEAGNDGAPIESDAAPDGSTVPQFPVDSLADFWGVQGAGGWYYGYYDLTADTNTGNGRYDAADFRQMTSYDGSWFTSTSFWTHVTREGGHPNGLITSGTGHIAAEHWAIRRWVSSVSARLRISGHVQKNDAQPASDGVIVKIFIDGAELYSSVVSGQDTAGYDYVLCFTVGVGTFIDFAIGPGATSSDRGDNTGFTATITAIGPGDICQ